MRRTLGRSGITGVLCLLALATQARAQYHYPPGYGGYGWHGWGGGSGSGRTAAGMGAMAAGAGIGANGLGQGRVNSAQARSMNAQTAMGVNNYMWECNQRNNNMYRAKLAGDLVDNNNAIAGIHDRILNHPNEIDIANGDTLNALLAELMNPKVYPRALDLAQKPLRSDMIKSIPFEYAAGGITYSLGELTDRDNVPEIYTRPEFVEVRKTLRTLAKQMNAEANSQRQPKRETIKQFRAALTSAKGILEGLKNVDDGDKFEAAKYLKALFGLTKMIDSPEYDVYLAAVDQEPTAPLCEVLIFMHSFNLQFGPSKDPTTREYYSMLYGMLSDLRQAVNPPPGDTMAAGTNGPERDNRVTNFYGGMPYDHVMAPNGPPPAPGQTR